MLATIAHTTRYKLLRKKTDQPNGIAEIHVWFRRPNCGKSHHTRELTSRFNFEVVYYCNSVVTPCAANGVPVRVRMPWVTEKALPELKKVFGEPAKILVADTTKPCYAPYSYGPPAKVLVAEVAR